MGPRNSYVNLKYKRHMHVLHRNCVITMDSSMMKVTLLPYTRSSISAWDMPAVPVVGKMFVSGWCSWMLTQIMRLV